MQGWMGIENKYSKCFDLDSDRLYSGRRVVLL
jgi:hypothetical protein